MSKTNRHSPIEDFGEARSNHHHYNRGAMSDAHPYNEYNSHDNSDYGTESRQSYGRGYGADNSFEDGTNSKDIFGNSPCDHSWAANPGPQVERPVLNQNQWDQDNGTWKNISDFFRSPGGVGQNIEGPNPHDVVKR